MVFRGHPGKPLQRLRERGAQRRVGKRRRAALRLRKLGAVVVVLERARGISLGLGRRVGPATLGRRAPGPASPGGPACPHGAQQLLDRAVHGMRLASGGIGRRPESRHVLHHGGPADVREEGDTGRAARAARVPTRLLRSAARLEAEHRAGEPARHALKVPGQRARGKRAGARGEDARRGTRHDQLELLLYHASHPRAVALRLRRRAALARVALGCRCNSAAAGCEGLRAHERRDNARQRHRSVGIAALARASARAWSIVFIR